MAFDPDGSPRAVAWPEPRLAQILDHNRSGVRSTAIALTAVVPAGQAALRQEQNVGSFVVGFAT
jgi:hypothetical protein